MVREAHQRRVLPRGRQIGLAQLWVGLDVVRHLAAQRAWCDAAELSLLGAGAAEVGELAGVAGKLRLDDLAEVAPELVLAVGLRLPAAAALGTGSGARGAEEGRGVENLVVEARAIGLYQRLG